MIVPVSTFTPFPFSASISISSPIPFPFSASISISSPIPFPFSASILSWLVHPCIFSFNSHSFSTALVVLYLNLFSKYDKFYLLLSNPKWFCIDLSCFSSQNFEQLFSEHPANVILQLLVAFNNPVTSFVNSYHT